MASRTPKTLSHNVVTMETSAIEEFRMVLDRQPTPFFFLQQISRKAIFFLAIHQRQRDRTKHFDGGGREIRFNLFGALYTKLLVPTCFAISGYP